MSLAILHHTSQPTLESNSAARAGSSNPDGIARLVTLFADFILAFLLMVKPVPERKLMARGRAYSSRMVVSDGRTTINKSLIQAL